MLRRLLGQLEGPDFVVPSFDVMESYGTIRNIKPRFSPKTGKFLGINYRTDPFKPFKEIIVKGNKGILRYTKNKALQPLLNDFGEEVVRSSEMYQEMSNGIIDSEMKWDTYIDGLNIDRGNPQGWVEGKREKDRVRQEIKREYLTQIEAGMDELFPKLLNEFETLKVSERNGVPYTGYIQNIMRPISHMTWYQEKDIPEDVYDREVAVMEE